MGRSHKADICTAYFNLRGWKKIANFIDKYEGGEKGLCRLLLGMYATDYQLRQDLIFEKLDNITKKSEEVKQTMDDIYNYPLSHEAEHTLQRMFRRKILDKEILNFILEK